MRLSNIPILLLAAATGCVDGSHEEDDDFFFGDRIVGGEDSVPGEFPFFIRWRGCGLSLIWEDVALTAAHVSSFWTDRQLGSLFSMWEMNLE
jgi:hypothetical protein